MKLPSILLAMLIFAISLNAQSTIILRDTSIENSAIRYTQYPRDSFPAQIEHTIADEISDEITRYGMKVQSFFWDTLIAKNESFDTLYFYTYVDAASQTKKLRFISQNKAETKDYSTLDTLQIVFHHKNEKDFLEVPLVIKDLEDPVTFYVNHFQYGYIPELAKYLTIWPYQTGVSISLGDSVTFNQSADSIKYRVNEKVAPTDSSYFFFTNYDIKQGEIDFVKGRYEGKLSGYKAGFYLDKEVFTPKKLTVLYFGGHWCGPCKKENPSLLKMLEIAAEHDFDLKVFLTYQEGAKAEAEQYYLDNLQSTDHRLIKLGNEIIHKLRISTYPSYVLLDQDGKIIYRSDSSSQNFHSYFWAYLKANNNN